MVASHFQPLPMMETPPLWCSSSNANRTNSFPIRSSCPLPASIASRGGGRAHTMIPFQALGFESCSCQLDRFMSVFKGVSCSRRSWGGLCSTLSRGWIKALKNQMKSQKGILYPPWTRLWFGSNWVRLTAFNPGRVTGWNRVRDC
jgi:hypothetical protein